MLPKFRLLIFIVFFAIPHLAQAASIYFSPSGGTYGVGKTFSVYVIVSSADKAMNAVSANLSFPADLLSVTSISKTNSIVNFWVQEPSYSNSSGTISLEGVVLNPGYVGTAGRVATITFRAKDSGAARVAFSSGDVLANDGLGTSILATLGSGTYTLTESGAEEAVEAKPKQESAVDNEKPSKFTVTEVSTGIPGNPKAKFLFQAEDKGSGVDRYEVQIDNGEETKAVVDASNMYETPALLPGEHALFARVFDKSGNYLTARANFSVSGLNAPRFVSYERNYERGDVAVVRATTEYRDVTGVLTFAGQSDDSPLLEVESRVGADGTLLFVTPMKLEKGTYRMWAKVKSDAGGLSNRSEIIEVSVPEGWWVTLGNKTIAILSLLVPILALLAGIALLFWYGWHKYQVLKKKMHREALEAEGATHKAFGLLREDLHDLVVLLRKTHLERKLTKEEMEVLKRAKKAYDDAEDYIEKEIKDIQNLS